MDALGPERQRAERAECGPVARELRPSGVHTIESRERSRPRSGDVVRIGNHLKTRLLYPPRHE